VQNVRLKRNDEQVIWTKLTRRATALAVPVRRLSWSISSHFVAIHTLYVQLRSHGRKIAKTLKSPILGVQG